MSAWTRKQLSSSDKEWLKSLGYQHTIAHASLEKPVRWQYVFDTQAAMASLRHQKSPLCFFGHTHIPMAFIFDTTIHTERFHEA